MAAQSDDPVANLESFCAQLQATSGQLKQATSTLESHDEELDGLDETRLDEMNSALAQAVADLAAAQTRAAQALEQLDAAVQEASDSDLASASERLDEVGSEFEGELEQARSTLDQDFSDLEGGFEELSSTADDVRGEVDGLGGRNDEAFVQLEGGLEEAEGRAEQADEDTAEDLGQAAEALAGEEASDLDSAASEAVEGWGELPGEFESDCGSVSEELDGAYQSWQEDALGAADELVGSVDKLLAQAAEKVSEQGSTLGEGADAAGSALQALGEEATKTETVEGAGAETATALTPTVDELKVALEKVDIVEQLLQEMG